MISIAANSVANWCERNTQKQISKKKNKPPTTIKGKLFIPPSLPPHFHIPPQAIPHRSGKFQGKLSQHRGAVWPLQQENIHGCT